MKTWSRRSRSLEERFWEKVDVRGPDDCWLWTASLQRGYGQIGIRGQKAPAKAHRVSWELHNGTIPDGDEVLHKCDNPPCVNPRHLFLGTQVENLEDMTQKNRRKNGVSLGMANSSSKLTDADIPVIRNLVRGGKTHGEVAGLYRVSRPAISAIIRKQTWAQVLDNE